MSSPSPDVRHYCAPTPHAHDAFTVEQDPGGKRMFHSDHAVATLERVTRKFGDITALAGVDLAIPRGRVLGLLGPNGAGKTTLVRLLLGMMRPTSGTVSVFAKDPRQAATRTRMGAML